MIFCKGGARTPGCLPSNILVGGRRGRTAGKKVVKQRLSALQLAEALGNVSRGACPPTNTLGDKPPAGYMRVGQRE